MADTFLGPVIRKLVDLLAEEVKSLKGVRKEVQNLQNELDFSCSFLKYAEGKPEKGDTNDLMLTWVKQVMDEANRAEEIIDEYRYLVEAEKHHRQSSFRKAGGFFKDLKQRRDMASKIQEVNDSLGKIKERVERYGLRLPLEQGASSTTTNVEAPDPRLKSRFIEKDELVGIETKSKEIIQKLLEESPTRSVISLVGQGGIGKTTLATSVYDDAVVQEKFESRAWITVSRPFNLKKILKSMRRQVCKSEPGMEEVEDADEQIQYLRESLEAKRYLVVFDDVWQKEFWGAIESALPKNNKGSRIVVTTRNVEVANSSPCVLVPLQPWSLENALELFRKMVGQCPKELEDLSRAIVRRCHGLPLVIATVARLLSKSDELEWQRVLDDLNSKSEMDSELLEILSLSYYDLPSPLKSCFLYFGIFPEDSSISDERLYRLWIAEGFIEARGNRTLEEVAEAYLNELIQRNLVTFQLRVGEGKVCGVHDLMHEVILSRADKVCLCRTWDENEPRFRGAGRRLRISGNIENLLKIVGASTLRSVFFWDIYDELIETESFVVTLFKRFKLLEVMDFQRVPLNTLPKEVGNLFLLKYLSLRTTNVMVLPKSIRNLQKLQTLDIRDTLIRVLPAEINELRNLRQLLAYTCYSSYNTSSFDYAEGVRMQEGFGNLENLQTLTLFEAHPGGVGLVKELELLKNLRWLDVSKISRETWRGVCASIGNMDHLQRLGVVAKDENEVLDLQHISSPPRFLRELVLTGQLQNFHEMIPVFRNLRGLGLVSSWLIDDPCKCLKELPNLESLELLGKAYMGEELHFEKGGFEKLKELEFERLDGLKHIKIDGGALPALEKLVLYACPLLEKVHSVNHLTKLKHFEVDGSVSATEGGTLFTPF